MSLGIKSFSISNDFKNPTSKTRMTSTFKNLDLFPSLFLKQWRGFLALFMKIYIFPP